MAGVNSDGGLRARSAIRPTSAALLGLCALAFVGAGATSRAEVADRHGAWETRCETPPGASSQQCAIVQSVVDEDRPNITLGVIAPLGVLIPTGLGLKLDQEDFGRMSFVRCLPNGCVAEVVLEDKVLDKM